MQTDKREVSRDVSREVSISKDLYFLHVSIIYLSLSISVLADKIISNSIEFIRKIVVIIYRIATKVIHT